MTKTKQRTSTDFLALTISAGEGRESDKWDMVRYAYRVQVQSDATDKRITFDYFDSADRYGKGINQLDRENLLFAFHAFTNDAQAGDESFDEFCANMGYDVDSISAKRTHDACKVARRKFRTLWHDDREPAQILELLALEGIE